MIEEAVEMVHFVVEKSPTPTGGTIKVSFEVPSLPPILGYSAELRHVFANLLLNARDALPSGGNIDITGELLEEAIVIGSRTMASESSRTCSRRFSIRSSPPRTPGPDLASRWRVM